MKRCLALFAPLCLLCLGGCGAGGQSLDTITVTYVAAPLNVPSMVEREQEIFAHAFASQGIGVEYAEITNGSEQTQALASGDVQFLFAVGAPSVLLAAANGADIRVIDAYSSSPRAYQIVTGDAGLKSAPDLTGKTVAGPKGTTLNELLAVYLEEGGLTLADVDYLAMSIGDAQAALEAGQVDAALLAGANAYTAVQEGYRVLADGEGRIDGTVLVAASGQFCEEYPQVVETFRQAHRAVLAQLAEEPGQALQTAARETGLDQRAVEAMYSMYDFHADLTEEDIRSLEQTAEFMLEAGMIEQAVSVEDLLDLGEAAGPDAAQPSI